MVSNNLFLGPLLAFIACSVHKTRRVSVPKARWGLETMSDLAYSQTPRQMIGGSVDPTPYVQSNTKSSSYHPRL